MTDRNIDVTEPGNWVLPETEKQPISSRGYSRGSPSVLLGDFTSSCSPLSLSSLSPPLTTTTSGFISLFAT